MVAISLLTDFGLKDNFVGVIKGVVAGINPRAHIIDITHEVAPQNILHAAFLLKNSFRFFPPGTIHLVVVDPGVGTARKRLLVQTKNYYFIAPDNGVLSLALEDEPARKIIEIRNKRYFLQPVSDTFHGRDIFAPVAAYLSRGIDPSRFGEKIHSLKTVVLPKIHIRGDALRGEIIYRDYFGNAVSNIGRKSFEEFVRGRSFTVRIKNSVITGLAHSYAQASASEPVALMDSFDFLEIAVRGDSAEKRLKIKEGDTVTVTRTYL